jgi:hypothetical protein
MTILNARNLSLEEVHSLLDIQRKYNNSFSSLLSLEPLSQQEHQELRQIQNDFDRYLTTGKVSEGQVKFIVVAPLMRLAGFYSYPIEIRLEEEIANIEIEDEDKTITGRIDILAVNKANKYRNNTYFWTLVIESKNSQIDVSTGLPQLLTYTNQSLTYQQSVWGLVTNGRSYQFICLQQDNPSFYQIMPELNLMESSRAIELFQVLKAICQL